MDKIISFPHMGDYSYFVKPFLEHITNEKVIMAPPITKKTLELGSKNSPDFICLPFKYNMGNYIETLNNGANILFQFGGGCRYGNYGVLQKQILEDLGYEFKFYELMKNGKTSFKHIYKIFKEINNDLTKKSLLKELLIIIIKIIIFDKSENYTRLKVEKNKGEFKKLKYKFINDIKDETNILKILKISHIYKRKRKGIKKIKPVLKIGIIGELYTAMEPFSTFELEKELKNLNISVKRFTNVSYLLIYKKFFYSHIKFKIKNYLKYKIGADATDNVYRTLYLKKKKYDGIIHTKPFGCTPEVGVIPILNKISNEKNIPIIYLSFDTATSDIGFRTRLEAFYDMLLMRKEQKNGQEKSLFRNRHWFNFYKGNNN